MNKLYIFLFAFIATAQSIFADSELFLKINKPGKYQVFLNNESVSSKKNIFRFFDLSPGYYQIKVMQKNGWQQQIVFQENVQIQNGFRYVAEINPNFGLQKIAQIPYIEKTWYIDQLNSNYSNHTCNANCNPYNCNNNSGWNNSPSCPSNNNSWNTTPNNYPNPNNHHNNWNNNYGGNQCMDNATFQSLLGAVKNTTFDDSKKQIIETALINNMIQTNQVKQLIQQITFESNKLEVAKLCYNKTIDKQNYFDIYNAFTFSSTINELNKYIAKL